MGCASCVILAVKRGAAQYWLGFGVIAALGLEEKYSIALFVFALMLGLLLAGQWRVFLSRWLWWGALAGLLIFGPICCGTFTTIGLFGS